MPPKKKKPTRRQGDLALGLAMQARGVRQPPSLTGTFPKIARHVNGTARLDNYAQRLSSLKDSGEDLFETKVRAFLGPQDIPNLVRARNEAVDRAVKLTDFSQTPHRIAFGALNGVHGAQADMLTRKNWDASVQFGQTQHRSTVSALLSSGSSYEQRQRDSRRAALEKYLNSASADQFDAVKYKLFAASGKIPGAHDLMDFVFNEYEHDGKTQAAAQDADEFVMELLQKQ